MARIVWNPTDETFSPRHQGLEIVFPPNEKIQLDEARAAHILSAYGQRGLTPLEFNDQNEMVVVDGEDITIMEQKRRAGRRAWKEFRLKQIGTYNQQNERNKARHMEYLMPTADVQRWAKELNQELIQPYTVTSSGGGELVELRERNLALTEENSALNVKFDTLTDKFDKLIDTMSSINISPKPAAEVASADEPTKEKEEVPKEPEAYGFEDLTTAEEMEAFVVQNDILIKTWPAKTLKSLKGKYTSKCKKPFPF